MHEFTDLGTFNYDLLAAHIGSVRDENNVLQLWPAVTLVEQLRMWRL